MTESNVNYNAKHNDSFTIGIGGIKSIFWADLLGNVNPNSLEAIDIIISHLIDKNNGSIYKAIADYKGADKNMKTTDRCWNLYKKLEKNK